MTIQSEVYVILLLTFIIGAFIIYISKKLDKADPLEKPKGILVPVIWGCEIVMRNVKDNVGPEMAENLTPYIMYLCVYIFMANTASLFGLACPTGNLSVTLSLTLVTWTLIQYTEFKYGGVASYFHAFIEPIPLLLPLNIIGKFSNIISLSFRLFGNILCGSIIMEMVFKFNTFLSGLIIKGCSFNFLDPILTPILHAYFDVFAGFVQTTVFVMLTMVLIGVDVPEEYKKEKMENRIA